MDTTTVRRMLQTIETETHDGNCLAIICYSLCDVIDDLSRELQATQGQLAQVECKGTCGGAGR